MRLVTQLSAVLFALFALCSTSHAAYHYTLCAGSSAEIADDLNTVVNYLSFGGIVDEIRIKSGSYAAPSGGWTGLNTTAALGALAISGGWNADCSAQTPDARRTVLDGQQTNPVLLAFFNQDLKIANLTLTRGLGTGSNSSCLGLNDPTHTATFELENLIVSGCTSAQAGGAAALVGPLYATVRGLLSVDNSASDRASFYVYQTDSSGLVRISQSTFAGNLNTQGTGSIVKIDSQAPVYTSNNALLYNAQPSGTVTDLYVTGPSLATFKYSVYGNVTLPAATLQSANVQVGGTQFIFLGVDDFRSKPGTPMRDGGSNSPDGGALAHDVFGGARVLNGAMDVGALETDAFFADGFE